MNVCEMAEAPPPLFTRKPKGCPPRPRMYRTSGLTVEQFFALPHAEQMRVDDACSAGLTYELKDHESGRPYWAGKKT